MIKLFASIFALTLFFWTILANDKGKLSLMEYLIRTDECDPVLDAGSFSNEVLENLMERGIPSLLGSFKLKKMSWPKCQTKIIDQVSKLNLDHTNHGSRKIIILSELAEKLDSRLWRQNSLVIFMTTNGKGQTFLKKSCQLESVKVAHVWNHNRSTIVPPLSSLNDVCQTTLRNQTLKAMASGPPPFVRFLSNGAIGGVDANIIRTLGEALEFRTHFEPGQFWGTPIGNTGYWSGVIGQVQNGTFDLGIGSVMFRASRYEVVDYSTPVYPLTMNFISPIPKPLKSYMSFLKPFSFRVWLGLLIVLIVNVIGSTLVTKLTTTRHLKKESDWGRTAMGSFAVLMIQPLHKRNTNVWLVNSSPMSWLWAIFVFFIVASYNCNLRAYLMQTNYEKPIDSEKDLLDRGQKLWIPEETPLVTFFAESPVQEHQEIYKDVKTNRQFFNIQKGFPSKEFEEMLIKRGDAMLYSGSSGLASLPFWTRRHGFVPFRVGRKDILNPYAGFVMPKDSVWKNELNKGILRMTQAGLIDKLFRESLDSRYILEPKPNTNPVAFQIQHVMGAVFVLFGGLFLAVLVFIVEKVKRKEVINNEGKLL